MSPHWLRHLSSHVFLVWLLYSVRLLFLFFDSHVLGTITDSILWLTCSRYNYHSCFMTDMFLIRLQFLFYDSKVLGTITNRGWRIYTSSRPSAHYCSFLSPLSNLLHTTEYKKFLTFDSCFFVLNLNSQPQNSQLLSSDPRPLPVVHEARLPIGPTRYTSKTLWYFVCCQ